MTSSRRPRATPSPSPSKPHVTTHRAHHAPRAADGWNRRIKVDGAIAVIFVSYSQKTLAVLDIIDLS
ncbi:hypothetical protein [Streptomyces sp. N2A]|uniref:hypothetical protein n=1 Tax=Streptomyces sp. N2A TaxID=3073936 RepID=UPI00286FC1AC|nr:hypothetical protein [Streptomyces sp. N2A]